MSETYDLIDVGGEEMALGRIEPSDFSHVDANPLITAYTAAEVEVELDARFDVADLAFYYQNGRPACIGFGTARSMTVLNGKRYRPYALYQRAQKFDGIRGPHAGSTVHGVTKVLIDEGVTLATENESQFSTKWAPELPEGIESTLWARSVDDCRTCLANRVPLILGVSWYSGYGSPRERDGDRWIGGSSRGRLVGGHCVCVRAASDRRQALGITNSHGAGWGELVWTPYSEMEMWLRQGGEVAVIVDRSAPDASYDYLLI